MAELVFSKDGDVVFHVVLNTRSLRVGHSPRNDLVLPGEGLAPFQVALERCPEGFRAVDHSGQGTPVNGTRQGSVVLRPGDSLQLGRLTARFHQEQTEPVHTARRADAAPALGPAFLLRDGTQRLGVSETGLRIGRDPSNDVVLTDGLVSSFHALVCRRGDALVVRDLGSTNGTFINSIRIAEAEAPLGSTITIGQVPLQVVGTQEMPATPPAPARMQCVGELIYADPRMEPVAAAIRSVAPHEASVCIMGESGVGKELVARAIHQLGPRAAEPFVAVNCAALSPHLVESELFGHERGAFTGAERTRVGAFEEAGKGTLFLDEVGDLPADAQAKLLRALENREIRRVGAEATRRVLCRVVTATHQNLVEHSRTGRFRNDLFHRLTALPIRVPPLRQRPADLPVLCEHLLEELSKGKARLTPAAIRKLQDYPFPGNIRELKNVLVRAVVNGNKPVLDAAEIEFLPAALSDHLEEARVYSPGRTLADIELEAMEQAVAAHGSQVAAARELGISRTTLVNRLKGRGRKEPVTTE